MNSLPTHFSANFQFEAFVALATTQLNGQVDFYRAFLAVEPVLLTPTYAEFRLLGLRLALFMPKPDHRQEFAHSVGSPMSLCLEVADLRDAIARLQSLGYPPSGDIMHTSHGQEIYAYDPDGNRLILHFMAA
ncbi:MAG: VOC family protein [Phormidesmis sp.]